MITIRICKWNHIACITSPSEVTPSGNRVQDYLDAFKEAGLPYDADLILHGDFKPESAYRIAQTLLAHPSPPSAFFSCNDLMAFGVLGAVSEVG